MPNKQKYIYLLGGLSTSQEFSVYSHTIDTCERAVKERLFYVSDGKGGFVEPPKPKRYIFNQRLKTVESYLRKTIQYAAPLTREQFLGSYEGRRRAVYTDAMDSLLVKSLTWKDAILRYFIKVEKTDFTAKPNAVPRGINPRNPRYHVSIGPYIKRIVKNLYRKINELFGRKTIFKGLNSEQRGKHLRDHWESFAQPVAVGLDASRFDQHVSEDALRWEHGIYKLYFPRDKAFHKMLKWQINNTGVAYCTDGKLKYKKYGGRMSGDMNTALGNCTLMSSMVYAYLEFKGIKGALANDGDDCVVMMEAYELEHFMEGLSSWFLDMGFNMTIESPVYDFEQIEFCQCNPIYVDGGYIMVRSINKALAKDCVSIKPLDNDKVARKWLAAVAEGGMSLTGGIPIWQEFYKCLSVSAKGAKPLRGDPTQETGMSMMAKDMHRKYKKISSYTRYSFYVATGVSPDMQVAFEEVYKKVTLNTSVISTERHTLRTDWL